MSIVTAAQAATHLRSDDADTLQPYIDAAEESVQQFMNRSMYADDAALEAAADDTGIVANPAIIAAILLLTGHLYANREDTLTGLRAAAVLMPMGSQYLLAPYRINQGIC